MGASCGVYLLVENISSSDFANALVPVFVETCLSVLDIYQI